MSPHQLPFGRWVPLPDVSGVPQELRREGAYVPPALPSDLVLPPATYRRAAEAEHALGRLDEAANRLKACEGLVRSTQVRDAQSSASLAGVHVGLRQALAEDLVSAQDSGKRPGPSSVIMPFLHAYDHGLHRVRGGARVDLQLMGELSAIMTGRSEWVMADVLRAEHGRLGSGASGPYLLTAMGPHLMLLLEQWADWAENETAQPRIVKLAIAHYQLEVLQPFPTANGHVARGFSMLDMVRQGLLRNQILPLSLWLDDALDEYQRQVRAVVDTGMIHPWVDFFATAVHDQALAQLRLIDRLEELERQLSEEVPQTGAIAKVIADVISFPVINHRAIEQRYGVSGRYATDITRRLVKLEILTSWESRRYSQIFLCEPALDLLCLNAETAAEPRRSVLE